MQNDNSELKEAVKALTRADGKLLAKKIRATVKNLDSGLRNNADLFFQVEPFAKEFDEYGVLRPADRKDHHGFTISDRITSLGRQKQFPRYKAMLFGWLSYYHPDVAEAFCRETALDLPMYRGHPDLTPCSDQAKKLFERQPRNEEQVGSQDDEESIVPPVVDESDVSDAGSDDAEHDPPPPARNRKLSIFAMVSIVALLGIIGTGMGIGLWSQNWFNPDDGEAAPELPSGQIESNAEDVGAASEEGIEGSIAADMAEEEATDDDEAEQPEPRPSAARQVEPVWDQISAQAWSVQPLASFRSWSKACGELGFPFV